MTKRTVHVTVDRPMGSRHPDYPDLVYPVNYGYVEGVIAPDGEEQDAYVLGIDHPIDSFTGTLRAIIHRCDDVEDKWIVTPDTYFPTAAEIRAQTHFQEQFFDIEVVLTEK